MNNQIDRFFNGFLASPWAQKALEMSREAGLSPAVVFDDIVRAGSAMPEFHEIRDTLVAHRSECERIIAGILGYA